MEALINRKAQPLPKRMFIIKKKKKISSKAERKGDKMKAEIKGKQI